MFSIVIPLYNKEKNIKDTIQSILNQTFKQFEVIVVNDGSTDNSLQVVQQIQDTRVRVIDQPNGGVSSARNKGIEEAKYEWVAFLDADDLWEKEYLEEYRKAIINTPNVQWLISGFYIKSKKNKSVNVYAKSGVLDNVFEDLWNRLSIYTMVVCVKRELFLMCPELYFRVGMHNSEDREVWYKLCFIDKHPYYINKPLSTYDIQVENSLTKVKKITGKDDFLTMIERIEAFSYFDKASEADKALFRKFIIRLNRSLLGGRYFKGAFKESHKPHLGKAQYYIYKYTSFLPYSVRRVINKLHKKLSS